MLQFHLITHNNPEYSHNHLFLNKLTALES